MDIKNGYVPDEDSATFPEEGYSSLSGDQGSPGHKGCDQLAVLVTETYSPGLGSLVSDDDITLRSRSVGRVDMDSDGDAGVALMILERYDCAALATFGTTTKIRVEGFQDAPGFMHTDNLGNGAGCGLNKVINVDGNNPGAVVACEAQLADVTGAKPRGVIGSYALSGAPGALPSNATEDLTYVYAEPNPPGFAPESRPLITREPVDNDYFTGVKAAIATANSTWANAPSATTTATGGACTGSALPAAVDPNAGGTWFFDCPVTSFSGNISLPNATTVIFAGQLEVRAGRTFAIPRASAVYVNPPGSATVSPGLLVKGHFRMHTYGRPSCKTMPAPGERARLVVGKGSIQSEGGDPVFQACDTSVVLMGGQSDGCVPSTAGVEPFSSACNGLVQLAGEAETDWTAPNLANRTSADTTPRARADLDDLEDLALWTESSGHSTILGTGSLTLAGVFVLPNANPFDIGGSGAQDIVDSQYFTRKLHARGNGTLLMRPNPANVTRVPYFGGFTMVR